jgi:hypothetical protein
LPIANCRFEETGGSLSWRLAIKNRQWAINNPEHPQHGNPQHGNPEHGNPQHRNPQHGNPPLTIRKIGNRQLPIGNSNNSIAFRTHLLYSSRQFVQDSGPP